MIARTPSFAYGFIWCAATLVGACTPEALIGIDQRGLGPDSGSTAESGNGGAPAGQCLESDVVHAEHPETPIVVCCSPLSTEIAWAQEVLLVLNSARQDAGLSSLSLDNELLQTAIGMSRDWALHGGDATTLDYLKDDSAPCARNVNVNDILHIDAQAAWQSGTFSLDVVSGWLDQLTKELLMFPDSSAIGIAHTEGSIAVVFR